MHRCFGANAPAQLNQIKGTLQTLDVHIRVVPNAPAYCMFLGERETLFAIIDPKQPGTITRDPIAIQTHKKAFEQEFVRGEPFESWWPSIFGNQECLITKKELPSRFQGCFKASERVRSSHKTIVELDLVGYSMICTKFEEALDVKTVAQLNQQIQGFIDASLATMNLSRKGAVADTTGDGAILIFAKPSCAHRFAGSLNAITKEHNRLRKSFLAKRVFRIGAATGPIHIEPKPDGGFNIAGSTIARAVRLEAKATPGGLLVDQATFRGLSALERKRYGSRFTVTGKRDERFDAYAWQCDPDGPKSAELLLNAHDGCASH